MIQFTWFFAIFLPEYSINIGCQALMVVRSTSFNKFEPRLKNLAHHQCVLPQTYEENVPA